MRASKLKPTLLESFVTRNANMPVGMRGGDAWRWFLSNTVGPGTEYEMESKWLDSYLPGNTYKSLRDKWAAVLGAFALPGNMLGVYQGDITQDARWAAFKSWVATYYSLTIS